MVSSAMTHEPVAFSKKTSTIPPSSLLFEQWHQEWLGDDLKPGSLAGEAKVLDRPRVRPIDAQDPAVLETFSPWTTDAVVITDGFFVFRLRVRGSTQNEGRSPKCRRNSTRHKATRRIGSGHGKARDLFRRFRKVESMNQSLTFSLTSAGHTKGRGHIDAERSLLTLEAEPDLQVSRFGIEPRIALRVSAVPGREDRPHIDLQELGVELSLTDARRLAEWLSAETGRLGSC